LGYGLWIANIFAMLLFVKKNTTTNTQTFKFYIQQHYYNKKLNIYKSVFI